MARYIDADALYEQTAEWEASALAYIETLKRTPLEEMDEDEKAEWRRWTAILNERSAFKHDVADAPTADVVERKRGKWVDPANEYVYRCSVCEEYTKLEVPRLFYHYCPNCGAEMDDQENGQV